MFGGVTPGDEDGRTPRRELAAVHDHLGTEVVRTHLQSALLTRAVELVAEPDGAAPGCSAVVVVVAVRRPRPTRVALHARPRSPPDCPELVPCTCRKSRPGVPGAEVGGDRGEWRLEREHQLHAAEGAHVARLDLSRTSACCAARAASWRDEFSSSSRHPVDYGIDGSRRSAPRRRGCSPSCWPRLCRRSSVQALVVLDGLTGAVMTGMAGVDRVDRDRLVSRLDDSSPAGTDLGDHPVLVGAVGKRGPSAVHDRMPPQRSRCRAEGAAVPLVTSQTVAPVVPGAFRAPSNCGVGCWSWLGSLAT